MHKMLKILIFTDLDGSLLNRDTFKFDEIKDYINQLLSKGIIIIPNTSKTEKEILKFISYKESNYFITFSVNFYKFTSEQLKLFFI